MPSAIDPQQIPGKDIDPDAIETNARTIGTIAGSVRDNGSDVHLKWQGMAGVYSAPESGTLLGLMQPVSSQATQAGDNLDVGLGRADAVRRRRPADQGGAGLAARAGRGVRRHRVADGVSVRELNPAWISTHGSTATVRRGVLLALLVIVDRRHDDRRRRSAVPECHEGVARGPGLRRPQQRADLGGQRPAGRAVGSRAHLREQDPRALRRRHSCTRSSPRTTRTGTGCTRSPRAPRCRGAPPSSAPRAAARRPSNFVVKDFLWEGLARRRCRGARSPASAPSCSATTPPRATGSPATRTAPRGAASGLLVASGAMNSAVLGPHPLGRPGHGGVRRRRLPPAGGAGLQGQGRRSRPQHGQGPHRVGQVGRRPRHRARRVRLQRRHDPHPGRRRHRRCEDRRDRGIRPLQDGPRGRPHRPGVAGRERRGARSAALGLGSLDNLIGRPRPRREARPAAHRGLHRDGLGVRHPRPRRLGRRPQHRHGPRRRSRQHRPRSSPAARSSCPTGSFDNALGGIRGATAEWMPRSRRPFANPNSSTPAACAARPAPAP